MIVKNVHKLGMSKNMFSALQLEQYAVFFFNLDRFGPKYISTTSTTTTTTTTSKKSSSKLITKREANDYDSPSSSSSSSVINVFEDDSSYQYDDDSVANYDDYSYDDDTAAAATPAVNDSSLYSQWLGLPETMFKNVRLAESSLVQIHLTQVDASISIVRDAFSEIQFGESAKFQLMFQEINGHLVFDREAVNNIKLNAGLFEIWIDSHLRRTTTTPTTNPSSELKFNSKHKQTTANQESASSVVKSAIRVLNTCKNSYFKLFDYAINKVFLTSQSNFRIGFLNSESIMSVGAKSIQNFHLDR